MKPGPKRGREKFEKYKPLITALSSFIRIFPVKMREWMLVAFRGVPGNAGMALRYCILKTLALSIGDNVSVHENVFLLHTENLEIGNNVSIYPMCYLEAYGGIKIGNDVSIAHGTSILSVTHNYEDRDEMINNQGLKKGKVNIGNNIWIGAKVTVLCNIDILDGTVIGAGAVVTKKFPQNVVLGGVPAKILKER